MQSRKLRNPIFLFYVLLGYIIAQFSWWLYLIYSLYQKTYTNEETLSHKTWMLLGEGTVFLIILGGGAFMIKRAFKREKEVNQLQENFLQSVSHELKTPIASVGLFLQTLQKRSLDEVKRQEIYEQAFAEVERLNILINDILTARNIESENYFFNKTKLDLKSYIEDTVSRLKGTILKENSLRLDLTESNILFDRDALDSIMYNLITNAVKYSPNESEITFALKNAGETTILEIQDLGDGISEQSKKRVFDKFYRDENETTRKSKGTGLGLYISKFLIEQQGGKIQLLDNQPQGLIVQITFE